MKGSVKKSLTFLFTFCVILLVNFSSFASMESMNRGKPSEKLFEPTISDLHHPLINFYAEKLGNGDFSTRMNRIRRYEEMIRGILRNAGVPEELIFVSVIESGGHPDAIGSDGSGATGLWQLTPSTARSIGLTVNKRVDERLDPFKSTFAVANFFRKLYEKFHSWPLVLAAFNMGENALLNKIAKHGTGDFNELCKRGALPKQTRNYIYKIYAAARLGRKEDLRENRKEYLATPRAVWNVILTDNLTVEELAASIEIPVDVLMKLNPSFLSPFVPAKKGMFVTIPLEAKERYLRILGYGGAQY
ncbi:MAG: lytic transglycosylase domain-containing protein [Syntrophobacterales bacterium]|nr:lytic transglycosylase domain-containing protein [Syntrophobacterales bacterium]